MVLNLREPRKRGEDITILPISQPVQQNKSVIASATKPVEAKPSTPTYPRETAQPNRVTHTVAQGETLFAISRKYGVTVENLKSWNSIGSQNIISIGQKLVIFKP
ncbi:LysM domain-containing protein [Algoriphagus boritolerans]